MEKHHQNVRKLKSKFSLVLGQLNQALNNLALDISDFDL